LEQAFPLKYDLQCLCCKHQSGYWLAIRLTSVQQLSSVFINYTHLWLIVFQELDTDGDGIPDYLDDDDDGDGIPDDIDDDDDGDGIPDEDEDKVN
jgi:hypothetical protein